MKKYQVQSYSWNRNTPGNTEWQSKSAADEWTFDTFEEAKKWFDGIDVRREFEMLNDWVDRKHTVPAADIFEIYVDDDGEIDEYGDCIEYKEYSIIDRDKEEAEG